MNQSYIREKKIWCGKNYMEVDIFPYSDKKKKGKRSKKVKESLPSQKNINDKNAKRKFIQTAEANFGKNDFYITNTYSDSFLPDSIEDANKDIQNYLRRVKRLRQKKGLPQMKYMLVTSYKEKKNGEEGIRVHHHLLMNGGLSRDEMEELWKKKNASGQVEQIGTSNCRKIQPDTNSGITKVAKYLATQPGGKRRWKCSKNLTRPESRTNDYRYSRYKVHRLATGYIDYEYWEKQYKGYYIADKESGFQTIYNEYTGWSIYLKLRRKE